MAIPIRALALSTLLLATVLPAQEGLTEAMAAAREKLAAGDAAGALAILDPLRASAASDDARVEVASLLMQAGTQLRESARFDDALEACRAAVSLLEAVHGDADHEDVAACLDGLAVVLLASRPTEALPVFERALAMKQRLADGEDGDDLATGINNVAWCLERLGRHGEALPRYEQALAMLRRLHGEDDHALVGGTLDNLGGCLLIVGRTRDALALLEQALAMRRRLHGDDHYDVAQSLNNVATCLEEMGRIADAAERFGEVLAAMRRFHGDIDHPDIAITLHNRGACLERLGRAGEALEHARRERGIWRRLFGDRDHPFAVRGLAREASCLEALGRSAEALPLYEAALRMQQNLFGEDDHPELAVRLNDVACCLLGLGRAGDARPLLERALAMRSRLHGGGEHYYVAMALNNLAVCLETLGDHAGASARCDEALASYRRMAEGGDHPDVAMALNNSAICLESFGRLDEAAARYREAHEMWGRLFPGGEHPSVAKCRNNLARVMLLQGRAAEALPLLEEALAVLQGAVGEVDHPDVVTVLDNLAACLQLLGRPADALPVSERACAMIERLRSATRSSTALGQSLFDRMKKGGSFERLQLLHAALGRPDDALLAAERSRGRELLELLEQNRFDPLAEAEQRARRRGDEAAVDRIARLREELAAAELDSDRALHELGRLDSGAAGDGERAGRRRELLARTRSAATRSRQLLDERSRLLRDVLAAGTVRTAREIRAALRPGELFLEYTVTDDARLVHVVESGGDAATISLPAAGAALAEQLPVVLRRVARPENPRGRGLAGRGGDERAAVAASRELFSALVPPALWAKVRAARRVFVAPHRDLHALPFEMLVTGTADGEPVLWLDQGPPISYVPSGSALHWLRQRAAQARDDATGLDLLVVGDPSQPDGSAEVPDQGVFVIAVAEAGEGARAGLRPGDVLVRYDGEPLVDDRTLRDLRARTEAAIEDGARPATPIPLAVWRRGEALELHVRPGLLGVEVGRGPARRAWEATLGGEARLERITRSAELERLRALPPLRGARAETAAIESVFQAAGRATRRLLGPDATEPAVFDLAAQAKYLHFACHGIAEEYAGQSLSMLVLSQPDHVLPGDDGLLDLGDLLQRWRGRLSSCRLVVLSACRTHVGPTLRDEAPQALPIGFLFAGAPAVICSLWAVDDESTRELMAGFYARLLAGAPDTLEAFTAAKKALRERYPDPFHWAAFLYLGSP